MVKSQGLINTSLYILVALCSATLLSGLILASSTVSADDSVVDQINITVPVSCTMSGTGMNTHNAEIQNGTYTPNIGTTTLHAFCNDAEGFAIYAAGYTGNEIGGTNSNKLVGTSASSNATIDTGLATSAGSPDVSNWAMKLTMTQDSGDTTGTNAFTIDSAPNVSGGADASFSDYHVVPNEYTKVAHKNSGTDMTASTGGAKLTTTYAAYISKNQPAGTYAGQVKYTLIHPSSAVAGKLNITYDGNGLTFPNGKTTNLVSYDATAEETIGTVTKKSYANAYNEIGEYSTNTIGAPVGNRVVTIDGAESIHIAVTYGAPQNSGGPSSDLSIWAGNHPDYTNTNTDTALTSCGSTNAVNGAFSSNGSGGTQVTMECDIASDSVTFYDYSTGTSNNYSMGYYAVITGQGTITLYDKTVTSGTYMIPGDYEFLGWALTPDATEPIYVTDADILNAPFANNDGSIKLYAVWKEDTLNKYFSLAGKTRYNNGYYKIQDMDSSVCSSAPENLIGELVDERDNEVYKVTKLADGNCWMLENLRLDPTDSATAAKMNASNTNASAEAIYNLLNGGSTTTGWSNTAVADVDTDFYDGGYAAPRINNASKDTLVTSYGPASTNGLAKVGIYYNFCAASASTYCYAGSDIDVPDTLIDAPQDICPANWRMPTGGNTGEYYALAQKYDSYAINTNSLQYKLSTPLSGYYANSRANNQGYSGYWWSSTYGGSTSMNSLDVSQTSVIPYNSNSRYYGRTMRCLMSE